MKESSDIHPSIAYANAVIKGEILACGYVKLACKRHLNDIKRSKRKDFPYYFNERVANVWLALFGCLRLWKGEWAGREFKLELWQKFIVSNLFGWLRKDTHLRRFKKAYIEMARKNAKTTLMAGIAIGMLSIDGEEGGQVYAVATKEDQAKIVVNDTAKILKKSPEIMYDPDDGSILFDIFELRKTAHRVTTSLTNSFMTALGRDSETQDGTDPSCAIVDEYHAHDTDAMVDVMESGMGARKQPLLLIITTPGFNKQGPCYKYRENIAKILDGSAIDENVFGIIYTLDPKDKYDDPKVWIKSNPNLGVSVKYEYLQSQLIDAKNRPSKLPAFLTKNMGLWVDATSTWVPHNVWEKTINKTISISRFKGSDAWLALDLAAVKDTCALSILIPEENESGTRFYKFNYFWVPEETVRTRSKDEKVDYQAWAKAGHLFTTPGEVTRYEYIEKFIFEKISPHLNVRSIAYDRRFAAPIITALEDGGFTCAPYAQVTSHMNFPTKELEKLYLSKTIQHDGNPVMGYQMSCVIIITDSNDNVRIDKGKSNGRVDGPVSDVMALGQYYTDLAANNSDDKYWVA